MAEQAQFDLDQVVRLSTIRNKLSASTSAVAPTLDLRRAAIEVAPHEVGPSSEIDEGNHRKRQSGAEHDLAQHQRLRRISTPGNDYRPATL